MSRAFHWVLPLYVCSFLVTLLNVKQYQFDFLSDWSKCLTMLGKAMRKTFFSVFLCFAKDETDFFPYSNIHSKKYSSSVLAFRETNAEVNAELKFTKMTRKYSKYGTTV